MRCGRADETARSALSLVGPERWMSRRKASGLLLYYDYVARARRRRVFFLQDECVLPVEQCTYDSGRHWNARTRIVSHASRNWENKHSSVLRFPVDLCKYAALCAESNCVTSSRKFLLICTVCRADTMFFLLNCRDDKLFSRLLVSALTWLFICFQFWKENNPLFWLFSFPFHCWIPVSFEKILNLIAHKAECFTFKK